MSTAAVVGALDSDGEAAECRLHSTREAETCRSVCGCHTERQLGGSGHPIGMTSFPVHPYTLMCRQGCMTSDQCDLEGSVLHSLSFLQIYPGILRAKCVVTGAAKAVEGEEMFSVSLLRVMHHSSIR